jgi:hypothetical protein
MFLYFIGAWAGGVDQAPESQLFRNAQLFELERSSGALNSADSGRSDMAHDDLF